MTPVSPYRPPWPLFNGHLQTVAPHLLRRVALPPPHRRRLELPDGDFLDLDWYLGGARRLVVLSHGLEGDSRRGYVRGMAAAFVGAGWDALAWNCRSCGGTMNRLPRFYHHGDTDDLAAVVDHALAGGQYASVVLVGFSMGGSQTLKYLGQSQRRPPPAVRAAAVFSVPCDLHQSIVRLQHPHNAFYKNCFLNRLKDKMRRKAVRFPALVDLHDLDDIVTFTQFINRFMGPLHGFAHLEAFYQQASARHFLAGIDRPTLLVNAANDPMLAGRCYPTAEAQGHPHLTLEVPAAGGHVGFARWAHRLNWAEWRALQFVAPLFT